VSYPSRDQYTERGGYTTMSMARQKRCNYKQVLQGREKALGRDHTSTLDTVNDLVNLYRYEGKIDEAEEMY
jgi:hypothetical protein